MLRKQQSWVRACEPGVAQARSAHGRRRERVEFRNRLPSRCVDDALKVGRHGHAPDAADIGAAGVPRRDQANAGQQRCRSQTPDLNDAFAGLAVTRRPEEHPPVDTNVLDGRSLTQHVGPLQVHKGYRSFAASIGLACCVQLGLDAGMNAVSESGHGLLLGWRVVLMKEILPGCARRGLNETAKLQEGMRD